MCKIVYYPNALTHTHRCAPTIYINIQKYTYTAAIDRRWRCAFSPTLLPPTYTLGTCRNTVIRSMPRCSMHKFRLCTHDTYSPVNLHLCVCVQCVFAFVLINIKNRLKSLKMPQIYISLLPYLAYTHLHPIRLFHLFPFSLHLLGVAAYSHFRTFAFCRLISTTERTIYQLPTTATRPFAPLSPMTHTISFADFRTHPFRFLCAHLL